MHQKKTKIQQCSKGCQYCQTGKWICIFLTYQCEAGCSFCQAPFSDDRIWTEFGPSAQDVLQALESDNYLGIGFSGGDCFLVPDRLEKWLNQLHASFPDIYYWVYTNGLAAHPDCLQTLARLGMNEVRFNIAGIGYQHPIVIRRIQEAVKMFEHVAVEIPSIPQHYCELTNVLPRLADYGIHYLNLHEFLLSPNDPLAKKAKKAVCSFNLIGRLEYDRRSKENTNRVIDFCQENKFPFVVNNCTIEQKDRQMLYRRLKWANRVRQSWEKVSETGLLETYCRKDCIGDLQSHSNLVETGSGIFLHPDKCKERDDYQRIRFMPPMDVKGQRILIQ